MTSTLPGSFEGEPAVPTVTETAKNYLAGELVRHPSRRGCFRLRRGIDRRITTSVAEPSADDMIFRRGDEAVLAIAADLIEDLRGGTIDVQQMPDGRTALIVS